MNDTNENTSDVQSVSETYENNPRNVSESEGNDSEAVRNNSERSDVVSETFPNLSERTAEHTLSVRDTAKIFESAHFPLTERTVINWCNPNRHGITRLDCFFDEHDGKYFITSHSVDKALREEAEKNSHDSSIYENFSERFGNRPETVQNDSEMLPKHSDDFSERFGNVPNDSEHPTTTERRVETGTAYDREEKGTVGDEKRLKDLEQEVLELKILNKGKDYFIDQLKQDRQYVVEERAQLVAQLTASVKEVGVLETKLLQLETPRGRVIDTE